MYKIITPWLFCYYFIYSNYTTSERNNLAEMVNYVNYSSDLRPMVKGYSERLGGLSGLTFSFGLASGKITEMFMQCKKWQHQSITDWKLDLMSARGINDMFQRAMVMVPNGRIQDGRKLKAKTFDRQPQFWKIQQCLITTGEVVQRG